MSSGFQPQEQNTFNAEVAEALAELYQTDCTQETVTIDERPIPGSLSMELSEVELVAGGWGEKVKGQITTLKQFFPTGKWPEPLKSYVQYSVRGTTMYAQVKELQGDKDRRAQLLIGIGAFNTSK